jgi:hypothetical protein
VSIEQAQADCDRFATGRGGQVTAVEPI